VVIFIVEKPMALTIEECEAMNAAVERHGTRLVCGPTASAPATGSGCWTWRASC
jgi:hypothetical protein